MRSLAVIWKSVERSLVYFILTAYLVLEVLAWAVPSLRIVLDQRGSSVMIAAVLLLVFRFIDEKLSAPEQAVSESPSFGAAISEILPLNGKVRNAVIFAHSGSKYYSFVRDRHCTIGLLRICLAEPSVGIDGSDAPAADEARLELTEGWERLRAEGLIGQLKITFLEASPRYHFMVADKVGLFGLFKPAAARRVELLGVFFINSARRDGRAYLDTLEHLFDYFESEGPMIHS